MVDGSFRWEGDICRNTSRAFASSDMPRAQRISFLKAFFRYLVMKRVVDLSPLQFSNIQSPGTAEYCMQRKPTPSLSGVISLLIVVRFNALP